jgi:GNAT superfamily N-acetyltransferase
VIRLATPDDLPAITDLLARANETPHDVARVAEEKVFGAGVDATPVVRLFEEGGALAGVSVTCGRTLRLIAVAPGQRRRGIGTALLPEEVRVAFAEPGNYLTPGVLSPDSATRAFFEARGFRESGTTSNMETAQLPSAPPSGVRRASPQERERVLDFIERTFGRVWRFEASNAGEHLFFLESEEGIAGFAAIEANNRGLGFFGPAGVAPSLRGRGLGRLLLLAALAGLRELGHERAVIPWTDAIAFYEKSCGARVTHTFVAMRRNVKS